MIYFFFKIIFSLSILLTVYTIFKRKEIKILEILVLLFIFEVNMYLFLLNTNIINMFLTSLLIIIIYYLYIFLENKNINKKIPTQSILINRGIINFKELIRLNYTYDELLYDLKKNGVDNPFEIDYCVKIKSDLIIFKKDSIRNYPISLIIDGNILKDNLYSLKKTLEWLNKNLEDNNLCIKDINYAYYKENQIYFVTN